MNLTYLSPETDVNDYDKQITQKCFFCNSEYNAYLSVYNNNAINTCFLCHCVINYNKDYNLFGFIAKSKMTQNEIIISTWDYYNKNNSIPLPQEIDKNCQRIEISTYLFSKFTNKNNFENYRLFFTSKVENVMKDNFDLIFNPATGKQVKFLNYFDIPIYKFSEEEIKNINIQILKIKKKNISIISDTQKILNKRYQKICDK
jgi:hypothetical protein